MREELAKGFADYRSTATLLDLSRLLSGFIRHICLVPFLLSLVELNGEVVVD